MIDKAATDNCDGFKAAVWMVWEPRHHIAVIHAKAVFSCKILAMSRPASDAAGPICSLACGWSSL